MRLRIATAAAVAYASVRIVGSRQLSGHGQDILALALGSPADHMTAARTAAVVHGDHLVQAVRRMAGHIGCSVVVADLAAGSLDLESAVAGILHIVVAEGPAAGQRPVVACHWLRCHLPQVHMPDRHTCDLSCHEYDLLPALVAAPHRDRLLADRPWSWSAIRRRRLRVDYVACNSLVGVLADTTCVAAGVSFKAFGMRQEVIAWSDLKGGELDGDVSILRQSQAHPSTNTAGLLSLRSCSRRR